LITSVEATSCVESLEVFLQRLLLEPREDSELSSAFLVLLEVAYEKRDSFVTR
jgi:hypothetical protein